MVKASEVVEAARALQGAPYVAWGGWTLEQGAPTYMAGASSAGYPASYVKQNGVDPMGLINWARAECGLPVIGGIPDYYNWLSSTVDYDPSTPGEVGAIVINPGYWGGVDGWGDIAMISTPESNIIYPTTDYGVSEGWTDSQAHYQWANWTAYGYMPDVDYSTPSPAPSPSPSPEPLPDHKQPYELYGWAEPAPDANGALVLRWHPPKG